MLQSNVTQPLASTMQDLFCEPVQKKELSPSQHDLHTTLGVTLRGHCWTWWVISVCWVPWFLVGNNQQRELAVGSALSTPKPRLPSSAYPTPFPPQPALEISANW